MKKTIFNILILIILFSINTFSQKNKERYFGSIQATIIDKTTKQAMEYASITLFKKADSTIVDGTLTNEKGLFIIKNIPNGDYILSIDFIGFTKKTILNIKITKDNSNIKLKTIELESSSTNLDEVVIEGKQNKIEYRLDKKIINVGKDMDAMSGSATDVLENTPSVEVDIDGNVSLRGSSNFKVLIDGRPSPIGGSEILKMIPASSIKQIEIITNPSAKYESEGAAGIINIIMKKQKQEGISGSFNASVGTKDKYKTDFLLNFKKKKYSLFVGFDFKDNNREHIRKTERTTFLGDTSYYLMADGDMNMKMNMLMGRFGVNYNINKKTFIGASAYIGEYKFKIFRDNETTNYTEPTTSNDYFLTKSEMPFGGNFISSNINLTKLLDDKGQRLFVMLNYTNKNNENTEQNYDWETDENFNTLSNSLNIMRNISEGKSEDYRFQIDYSKPFTKIKKLELGYSSSLSNSISDQNYDQYSEATGLWTDNNLYSIDMKIKKNIHASYITFGNTFKKIFDYQVGLRGELTDREIIDKDSDYSFKLNRFDIFPTVHLSKVLDDKNQLQLSYSRKINRPNDRFIYPHTSQIDPNTIRKGNPELKPEYINSFEFNYLRKIKKGSLSIETYLRNKNDLINHVNTLGENNIVVITFINVNQDFSTGVELMTDYDISKKLNINITGNFYDYRVKGEMNGEKVDNQSFNWNAKTQLTLKVLKNTKAQLKFGYYAPSTSIQGTKQGFVYADFTLKQDLLKKRASLSLQVKNIIKNYRKDFTVDIDQLYERTRVQTESPIIMLTFSYNLNMPMQKRTKGKDSQNENLDMVY